MNKIPKKNDEKNNSVDRERISVYISKDTKKKWQTFANEHNISTFSKLIRQSVNSFLDSTLNKEKAISSLSNFKADIDITHEIKERLTTLKGNLQFFIENFKLKLNDEMNENLTEILEESKNFEDFVLSKFKKPILKSAEYDVLIIEDDVPTIKLITKYFQSKGFKIKGVLTGEKAIEELKHQIPKLIIIDIILPDISGFEICKLIKKDENYNSLPVFYLTAVPEENIEEKMEETMANGYILKPFDLSDLDFLFKEF